MASYRALVGIDYPPNKRAEAGEVVTDLPPQSVKWLLDSGLIEDSSKPAKKIEEPVVEEPALEMNRAIHGSTMKETAPEEPIAEVPASEESEAE